jgi:hypothetical protein
MSLQPSTRVVSIPIEQLKRQLTGAKVADAPLADVTVTVNGGFLGLPRFGGHLTSEHAQGGHHGKKETEVHEGVQG